MKNGHSAAEYRGPRLLDLGMGWLAFYLQYVQMASECMLGAGGSLVSLSWSYSVFVRCKACVSCAWTMDWILTARLERQVGWYKSKW